MSVILTDAEGRTLKTLGVASSLGRYSFDDFTGYSPPIHIGSTGPVRVPNDGLVFIVLEVANHERNLQIPIDDRDGGFNATVTWTEGGRT